MIPHGREEKIEWVQKHLLPIFDSRLRDIPEDDLDEENVQRSKEILAEEYLDEGRGIFKTFLKVALPLVIVDSVSYMPTQVYGLVFSIMGTMIMLVEADILGSQSITAQSMDTIGGISGGGTYLDEDEARRLARNTVITNIGLVWLVFGFSMQIVAVWLISSGTLIQPVYQFV